MFGDPRLPERFWDKVMTEAKALAHRAKLKRYGLSDEQFRSIMQSQGERCAICSVSFGDIKRQFVHVDHCHSTGLVRGLLCSKCNTGIGQFDDDPERLVSAAAYLKRSKS